MKACFGNLIRAGGDTIRQTGFSDGEPAGRVSFFALLEQEFAKNRQEMGIFPHFSRRKMYARNSTKQKADRFPDGLLAHGNEKKACFGVRVGPGDIRSG